MTDFDAAIHPDHETGENREDGELDRLGGKAEAFREMVHHVRARNIARVHPIFFRSEPIPWRVTFIKMHFGHIHRNHA